MEDFYFSSAAGRARIVLGNRRWGENGYVASGRQQGRPVQRTPPSKVTPGTDCKAKCAYILQSRYILQSHARRADTAALVACGLKCFFATRLARLCLSASV